MMSRLGPLSGIRVIEMGGLAPVPLAGMIMADFGAHVVRIDKANDPMPIDHLTRGKQSIVVDLQTRCGKAIVRKLCTTADVVIEPFRPGVMEKLELGPDRLCELNKRLFVDYDPNCFTDDLPYAMCQLCWLFMEAVTMDMLAATTGVATNARIGSNIVTNFIMYLTADGADLHSFENTIWDEEYLFTGMVKYLQEKLFRFPIDKLVMPLTDQLFEAVLKYEPIVSIRETYGLSWEKEYGTTTVTDAVLQLITRRYNVGVWKLMFLRHDFDPHFYHNDILCLFDAPTATRFMHLPLYVLAVEGGVNARGQRQNGESVTAENMRRLLAEDDFDMHNVHACGWRPDVMDFE